MAENQNSPDAGRPGGGKAEKNRPAAGGTYRRQSGDGAILNGEIEILPDRRMAHLDQGPVQAFGARHRGDSTSMGYFALICEPALVPRSRQAGTIASIINPALSRLIAHGVCYWPPVSAERYVLVYENNLGQPIMKPGDGGLGWKVDTVMQAVIRPVIGVLTDMRDADMYHGGIRPTNMYDGGAKVIERVIVGDCLATPPSYAQPVVYEPIERAMANPVARGRGTNEDDLYAFGVSLAVILRGRDPLEGISDDEIIQLKIEHGSYTALTGKERFTGAILELLRGLLYDERGQRWTLNEVQSWLDGQRLSPKQTARKIKAARPLSFNEQKYFRPSILAMDLYKNQAEAVQMVESDMLEQWIERSLEDKKTASRLELALASAQETGRGPGYWDRMLARVSIALDPEAPLRYKSMALNPDGIPSALAEAMIRKKDVQAFIDIVNQQLITYWVTTLSDGIVDIGALVSRFDNCRSFLRQSSLGYGMERCLYFLCPEAPCISDSLKNYHVLTPEEMVFAFEDMAKRPNRPHLFIDRHVAAFLSVKDKRVIDPFLFDLNAADFYRRIMGNLKVMALLQKRARADNLPGLASWVADILKPVYERYHDRELRVKLKERVDKFAASGDLSRMAAVLDDQETKGQDMLAFKSAMQEYDALRQESDKLDADLDTPHRFGREEGQNYAAGASVLIAALIILAVLFIHFSHRGM